MVQAGLGELRQCLSPVVLRIESLANERDHLPEATRGALESLEEGLKKCAATLDRIDAAARAPEMRGVPPA